MAGLTLSLTCRQLTRESLISGEPKRFSWLRALELRIKPQSVRASVDA